MATLAQRLTPILNRPDRPLASIAAVAFRSGAVVDEAYLGHRFIHPLDPTRNLPVTPDTTFRVSSISKLVATLGVMQLVEQNKLSLDADIRDYLGFALRHPHHPSRPITLAMLLSHTSSIRDGGEQYSLPIPYTVREFFEPDGAFYANGAHWAPSTEPPGDYFHYCNLNFGLVGTLIEIASGLRFDRYMRQHVLEPLGMDASYNVRDFAEPSLANLAALYRKQDELGNWHPAGAWLGQVDDYRDARSDEVVRPDHVVRIENPASRDKPAIPNHRTLDDYVLGTNGTLFSPQGGLRISARGLASIGMMICFTGETTPRGETSPSGSLNGVQILQPESIWQMLAPRWRWNPAQPNGDPYGGLMRTWGLGVQLITDHSAPADGDRLVQGQSLRYAGHAGDAYGLHSGLWFDPDWDSGFAYIVGGVGADPDQWKGKYSSFYRWEEEIMTALVEQ